MRVVSRLLVFTDFLSGCSLLEQLIDSPGTIANVLVDGFCAINGSLLSLRCDGNEVVSG
jgi:hypothetical protein